jgi:hypothetical protein
MPARKLDKMELSILDMLPANRKPFNWILLEAERAGNQREKEAGVEKPDLMPFKATARMET